MTVYNYKAQLLYCSGAKLKKKRDSEVRKEKQLRVNEFNGLFFSWFILLIWFVQIIIFYDYLFII